MIALPFFPIWGELLTVTALGGACFGLPTAIVAERERGVWRRYRASPAGAGTFVSGLVISRLVLLLSAGAIQLGLAMTLLGMPRPRDPAGLLLAFTVVSIALIGLGMVVAMLANTVPAVQALGQCIFLPLLMIGGVAVRIESLPAWTQALSTFFPGRYAVASIQATSTGGGVAVALTDLLILALFAAASSLVAASLFRWDGSHRRIGRPLLGAGAALWLLTGAIGLWTHPARPDQLPDTAPVDPPAAFFPVPASTSPSSPTDTPAAPAATPSADAATKSDTETDAPVLAPDAALSSQPKRWQDVSDADIARVAFERLPDDDGLVSPIAERGTLRDDAVAAQIAQVRSALPGWQPMSEPDPVQRTRNLLYVAAVPDLLQMDPLERHLPWLVFDRLRQEMSPADLARVLYWIGQHPGDGDDAAIGQLVDLGLPSVSGPTVRVRDRSMIYALKFLERLQETRLGERG